MKINHIDYAQKKTSFKSIRTDKSVSLDLLEAIANSKSMKLIAEKYNVAFENHRYGEVTTGNVIFLKIEKLKQEFNGSAINKFFKKIKNVINSKTYKVMLTEGEDNPPLKTQLSELTPEKIEQFIKKEEESILERNNMQQQRKKTLATIKSFNNKK